MQEKRVMASPFGISKRESTIEGRVVHELNRAVEKGNIREVISLALEQCRLSMERTHKKGLVEVDIEEYNDLFSNLQDKFTADLERDGISIPIPEVQFTDELNIAQGVGNAREVVSIILCQCHVCMHGVCTAKKINADLRVYNDLFMPLRIKLEGDIERDRVAL